jgi:hypothetical protein
MEKQKEKKKFLCSLVMEPFMNDSTTVTERTFKTKEECNTWAKNLLVAKIHKHFILDKHHYFEDVWVVRRGLFLGILGLYGYSIMELK